jgi:YD repeat-containing protein
MKVTYDPTVDIVRILFRDAPIAESDEEKPGMILDYDKQGNVVGMEILDASQRVEDPGKVEYALASESA